MATKRKLTGMGAALCSGALALTACVPGGGGGTQDETSGTGNNDQTLRIGVRVAGHNSFDPSQLQGGFEVFWASVYDTLLQRAPSGEFRPGAATEWSYNEDNTVLTLTLREGMTFDDGSPVNSQAAIATLKHIKNGTGTNAGLLKAIENFQAPNERTLVLRLSEPDPGLLDSLAASAGVVANPKKLDDESIGGSPAGSGPYNLNPNQTTTGASYTFTKDDSYWDASDYPYEKVVVKPLTNATARLNALKSGQVDSAPIEASMAAEAKASGMDITTQALHWAGFMIVDRSGQKIEALGDVRVRKAINMAFNRDAIVENLALGYAEPTQQIFKPSSAAHVSELEGIYDYNVDKAKKLMAEAGYEDGFEITLASAPFSQVYEPTIKDSLAAIGIKVNFESVPTDQVLPKLLSGEYPMFWASHPSRFPWYDISRQVAPGAIWNTMGAEDPRLNELINKAKTATTEKEANAAYQQIGRFLTENAWFAPILRPEILTATNAETDVKVQVGSPDPYVRNYSPASE
ncbi:ABC transporter substrate-binding protein [Arthrobacter castelli]|uniref:ABC transporter substrate-binding protein n=1 Tax=Arthrobacter castelli TaxID=271431 RepID=UPI000425C002|nr:ABC transporter substrate-binding protein [Arthrobacter castelli]